MESVKSQFCGFQWNGERGKRASPAPAAAARSPRVSVIRTLRRAPAGRPDGRS